MALIPLLRNFKKNQRNIKDFPGKVKIHYEFNS